MKAHMYYAKSLIKTGNIHKAVLIYKTLAQVQPTLFIPDVNYTKELQKASSKDELVNVIENLEQKKFKSSFMYSEALNDLDTQRTRLISSRKNLISILINDDADLDLPYKQASSEFPNLLLPETDSKHTPTKGILKTHDSTNVGFSVCSDYLFLYKIGKVAAKNKMFLEDGIQALHDFLNIHHYWMKEGIESDEDLRVKALFYLGILFHHINDYDQAYMIFRDIMSMLFQLGRTHMSTQIQEYFKQYEALGVKSRTSN